jgi:SHS2 domain-containing protein
MPYRFREDISGGDAAFEATGRTVEELFISAADAAMNVMVEKLETIRPDQEIEFEVAHSELDMLLFRFLNELIFLKDSRQLLIRVEKVSFEKRENIFILKARGYGQAVDPLKHPLNVDVKAVTLHRLSVKEIAGEGWTATVVLDV